MDKCFADFGIDLNCDALRVKECEDCKFYKPITSQIKVVVEDIKSYEGVISRQALKTLVGQAKAGDLEGARKGLVSVKNMRGL